VQTHRFSEETGLLEDEFYSKNCSLSDKEMAIEVLGWGHQITQVRIQITKFTSDNPTT
jgi:hypothetical protein